MYIDSFVQSTRSTAKATEYQEEILTLSGLVLRARRTAVDGRFAPNGAKMEMVESEVVCRVYGACCMARQNRALLLLLSVLQWIDQ